MRLLIFIILLLPITLLADDVRVAVGMDRNVALALIKKNGGMDIGPGMDAIGPEGEFPVMGVFWVFRDYDAIIQLSAPRTKASGKIRSMTFWNKKDFQESKVHRAQTEQRITALKIDTDTKRVAIEK